MMLANDPDRALPVASLYTRPCPRSLCARRGVPDHLAARSRRSCDPASSISSMRSPEGCSSCDHRHRPPSPTLRRTADRAPVRIAHVGLGAFHRAHQAWYTAHAAGDPWGIAAFTGRSPAAAEALAEQDGVYTLIERGPGRPRRDHRGDRRGPRRGRHVGVDPHDRVSRCRGDHPHCHRSRIHAGRDSATSARSRGSWLVARQMAARSRSSAATTCRRTVRRCGTRVLTVAEPGSRRMDRRPRLVRRHDGGSDHSGDHGCGSRRRATCSPGSLDEAPVVAEPFSEWILAGDFPAGRPAWETAGARIVADVAPYEERKLWLLNAAHSFLAYAGSVRGFDSIDAAFADEELRAMTEQLWAEQRAVISLPEEEIDASIAALRERFDNPRIRHSLRQIAQMGALKLPVRILEPDAPSREPWLRAGDRSARDARRVGGVSRPIRRRPTQAPAAVAQLLRRNPGADPVNLVIDTLTPEEQRIMIIDKAEVIVTSPDRNFVTLKLTTDEGHVGIGDATLNGRELAVVSYLKEHVVPLLIGSDASPHRGHLAVPLPLGVLAPRPGDDGRDRRGRHGAVGHQGQGGRDAGLPAARRRQPQRADGLRPRVRARSCRSCSTRSARTRSRATGRSACRPACRR